MNGISNKDPIATTFLMGSRFSTSPSIAICVDDLRSQEYFEITNSVYNKIHYDYDICLFSSDLNRPIVMPPFSIFYNLMIEQYRGDVIALTLRSAIAIYECGSIFKKKIWYISDLTEIRQMQNNLPALVDYFDLIIFPNETITGVFKNLFPNIQLKQTAEDSMDIMDLEKHWL